jgi:hypothetical protein
VVEGVELTSDEDVAKLPAAVGPDGLDVLIYNAAINRDSPGLEDIHVEASRDYSGIGLTSSPSRTLRRGSRGRRASRRSSPTDRAPQAHAFMLWEARGRRTPGCCAGSRCCHHR